MERSPLDIIYDHRENDLINMLYSIVNQFYEKPNYISFLTNDIYSIGWKYNGATVEIVINKNSFTIKSECDDSNDYLFITCDQKEHLDTILTKELAKIKIIKRIHRLGILSSRRL